MRTLTFKNIFSRMLIIAVFSSCFAAAAFCQDNNTGDVHSLVAEGRRLAKERRYDDAIKVFSQAKTVAPKSALPDTGLGIMFLKMGEYAEAERYLSAAEALDPNLVPVQYTLAMLYEKLGRNGDAIRYWNKLYETSQFKESARKHLKYLGVQK